MKWGRKKTSSSRKSFISHVFPISWLSRLKHIGQKSKAMPQKVNSQQSSIGNKTELKSVLYESENDELQIVRSSCQSCGMIGRDMGDRRDTHLFSNRVSDTKKMGKRTPGNVVEILRGEKEDDLLFIDTPEVERETTEMESKRLMQKVIQARKLMKKNQRILKNMLDVKRKLEKVVSPESANDDLLMWKPELTIRTTDRDHPKFKANSSRRYPCYVSSETRNSGLGSTVQNRVFLEWQNLKKMKTENLKERKLLYISRELPRSRTRGSSKARAQSPKTPLKVELCKIKAIEDLKKIKMKTNCKNNIKEKVTKKRRAFERFAVVKCSIDTHRDFEESMVQMIRENRITESEDLQELLLCYLSLNSYQHHDLIIEIFRKVWHELNNHHLNL